jgi:hypothetical protein
LDKDLCLRCKETQKWLGLVWNLSALKQFSDRWGVFVNLLRYPLPLKISLAVHDLLATTITLDHRQYYSNHFSRQDGRVTSNTLWARVHDQG